MGTNSIPGETTDVAKKKALKIFLYCEFTQLNQNSKLIFLAWGSESGKEFYVVLTDTYLVKNCSDFVIQNVCRRLITRVMASRLRRLAPIFEDF